MAIRKLLKLMHANGAQLRRVRCSAPWLRRWMVVDTPHMIDVECYLADGDDGPHWSIWVTSNDHNLKLYLTGEMVSVAGLLWLSPVLGWYPPDKSAK